MPQGQPTVSQQTSGREGQFQRRWEPTYHWRSMCSMLLGHPGARGLWPTSVVDYQRPECTDISGHGYDLQSANALGDVDFGRDPNGIAPIAEFSGAVNSYLFRADGGAGNWADVLGTEVYIRAADRGLSLLGWFYDSALSAAIEYLIAKDDGGANRQYYLIKTAANALQFQVWPGPVAVTSTTILQAGWNHVAGIYDNANQDLHVILNGQITSNLGAAPVALADTGAPFTIAADGAGANKFTGYGSDCLLCACGLTTAFVRAGYHYTKAAYGMK